MAVAPTAALPSPSASLPPDKAESAGAFAESDGPSFWDFLDVINPLQHIPLVNILYRELTGDRIGAVARVAGGALFGGPIGAGFAVANVALQGITGADVGDTVVAMVKGEDPPGSAEPPRPAASLYAMVQEYNDEGAGARFHMPWDGEDLPTGRQAAPVMVADTPSRAPAAVMAAAPAAGAGMAAAPKSAGSMGATPAAAMAMASPHAAARAAVPAQPAPRALAANEAMPRPGVDVKFMPPPARSQVSAVREPPPAQRMPGARTTPSADPSAIRPDAFSANFNAAMDKYQKASRLGAPAVPPTP